MSYNVLLRLLVSTGHGYILFGSLSAFAQESGALLTELS